MKTAMTTKVQKVWSPSVHSEFGVALDEEINESNEF
jgi:hypothetical protein